METLGSKGLQDASKSIKGEMRLRAELPPESRPEYCDYNFGDNPKGKGWKGLLRFKEPSVCCKETSVTNEAKP